MTRPDFFLLEAVRHRRPLIHCISNLVSANDCANLALAVGASPIMAQAPEEMEAVAAVSAAAVLNTGTPEEEKFGACLLRGQAAQKLGQPVVGSQPLAAGAGGRTAEKLHPLPAASQPGGGQGPPPPGKPITRSGQSRRPGLRPTGEPDAPPVAGAENRCADFRLGGFHLKWDRPMEGLRRQFPDDAGDWYGMHAVRPLRRLCGGGTGHSYRRRHSRRFLEVLFPPGGSPSPVSGPRQLSDSPAGCRWDFDGGGLRWDGLCRTPVLKRIPVCQIRQAGTPFAFFSISGVIFSGCGVHRRRFF